MAPSPAPPSFKPDAEWCERFAALWAGADDNVNDAESSGKWRQLRRMAGAEKQRVIDVMGCLEVMGALDAQLQPQRQASPELAAAKQLATDHCRLAQEAIAKAEHWAEVAKRQEAVIGELRGQSGAAQAVGAVCPAREYVGGVFAFAFVMAAAALLFAAVARIAAAVFG